MGCVKKEKKTGKPLKVFRQYQMPYHENASCPNGEDKKKKKEEEEEVEEEEEHEEEEEEEEKEEEEEDG